MEKRYGRGSLIFLISVLIMLVFLPVQAATEEEIELYARGAVLMDGDSGRILYGKEADTPYPMASTTKIMTCILALEAAGEKPDEWVCTASSYAAAQPEVKLGMHTGDTFYLKDLLYSLMLESHNDTAVCIAESIDGSVEAFAARMNRKAGEIGCRNTYYITPNGLDAEDEEGIHHTTAYDLALVMRYCLTASPQKDAFLEVTRTASYAFTCTDGSHSYSCSNHNAFLSMMDGALSGKTGFTGNAGYCYVGALMRDDRLYIVSLLGCGWPGHKGYKWVDTKKLMTYGLNNYTKHELTIPDLTTPSITVTDGQQTTLPTYIKQENVQQILMQEDEQIEVQIRQQDTVRAPVEADSQVGVVQYLVDGTIYAEYPILTQSGTGLRNYPYCLRQIVSTYLLSSE